ncbi:MAG: hypothetical protein ACRCWQ_03490 [Bacilli bacterium]
MEITTEAKQFVLNLMENYPSCVLKFIGHDSCCAPKLEMQFAPIEQSDIMVSVDGLEIAVTPNLHKALAEVTIGLDVIENEQTLVLYNYTEKHSCS